MKVGIICAGDREITPFYPVVDGDHVTEKAMLKVHEGTVCGVPAAVVCSGVCKVNASIAAQTLIDAFGVTAIINAGTASGMAAHVKLFDTVVGTQAAYHDVAENVLTESHPYKECIWFDAGSELLSVARKVLEDDKTVHFGRMVTGEQFITDEFREEINAAFAPLSVDMETAAIAHICNVNGGVPFLAVRSITDTADHAGSKNFEMNVERASEISKDRVLKILRELKKSGR